MLGVTALEKQKKEFLTRPPVVVILGHVDHGKTKLLDYIRKSNVVASEAGGITQHIGAYQAITTSGGKEQLITFLDTPGHEAFSAIRSRGTTVADIGILVVAADEGPKPQTKEAIELLQKAEMPFVVAINKIDKPEANVQKVKQRLADEGVLLEDWGGKVPAVEVSAETGQNVEQLLEIVALIAELEELKANPDSLARGVVIESHLDNQRGAVGTLLVLDGTLKTSDWIVLGNEIARVKAMEDFRGQQIKTALPAQPVRVLGWEAVPAIGQSFQAVESKKEAEKLATQKIETVTALFDYELEEKPIFDERPVLNIILKADVQSSLEAIDKTIGAIPREKINLKVVDHGVGKISDGDIKAAIPTQALVIGFNAGIEKQAEVLADRESIQIHNFSIIYELVELIRERMEVLLVPEKKRTDIGQIEILAIFEKSERFQIIGGKVISGKMRKGAEMELNRNGETLMTGKIGQLQQGKVDVEEVVQGMECGIRFDLPKKSKTAILPIRIGDKLTAFDEEVLEGSL